MQAIRQKNTWAIKSMYLDSICRSFGNSRRVLLGSVVLLMSTAVLRADEPHTAALNGSQLASQNTVESAIEQFSADLQTLDRRYRVPLDNAATAIRAGGMRESLERLEAFDFDQLSRVGQTDYLLLRSEIEYRLEKLKLDTTRDEAAISYLPYAGDLVKFLRNREDVEPIEAAEVAGLLDKTAASIEQLSRAIRPLVTESEPATEVDNELTASAAAHEDGTESEPRQSSLEIVETQVADGQVAERLVALRATELQRDLMRSLREAHSFYVGYDPNYTWWAAQPMERLLAALERHRTALREIVVAVPDSDEETIVGLPIGADGLALELRHEWIAHDPAELVQLAQREMAWCDERMAEASAELGCGDDWRKAMELVKSKHVQPGEQPQMIRNLAWEAIRFLEAHDLITIPPLAASGWTMQMMSPERQRVNPYFLGGDSIIVSFPTDSMTHEEKLMSMRSNNEHFSRATVHHELIPGHHLQYYMLPRYRPYRKLFATPFWMEGWALYWEMQMWDLDFAQGAEDRVGMLFWRKHRCARIIFSLNYHLGKMSPDECVDYLVERVGHERSAAAAEVRRSIMGGYSPLYQAAYMLGGLQLREMHKEFVLSGQLTNRQFHDAVMHEHSLPIEVLRNYLTGNLTGAPLQRDTRPTWRFAD